MAVFGDYVSLDVTHVYIFTLFVLVYLYSSNDWFLDVGVWAVDKYASFTHLQNVSTTYTDLHQTVLACRYVEVYWCMRNSVSPRCNVLTEKWHAKTSDK